MSCGCAGTKKKPSGVKKGGPGEIGLLKIIQVASEPFDVYGEVTDAYYPFIERKRLYVDTRDAVYLLGKDFELA